MPPSLPALSRPETVDLALRQMVARLEADFYQFVELLQEALDGAYYRALGYADPARYVEDHLGLSYSSVRRRLRVLEGVRALPAGEQDAAKSALATIGSHKAGILAAILKDPHEKAHWAAWVEDAGLWTVEELQAGVTKLLHLTARGAAAPDPVLTRLCKCIPPDAVERITRLVTVGKLALGTDSTSAVILMAFDVFARDLADQGVVVDAPPG